jgi:1-acyl-sn-glycerol-3-phosphate acyltransferase
MYTPSLADRVVGSVALRRRQALGRGIAVLLGRLEVDGLEHVPAHGPVVLAVNHRSLLDGPLIFGVLRRPASFLVKTEAFSRLMGPVLLSAGQVPVVRTRVDAAPVRLALRVLQAGGVVGIFPEGSRGDGLARVAKPGVGYFAMRAGAVVVPVACHGTDAMSHRNTLGRPGAQIIFGEPIAVERYPPSRPLNRRLVADTTEQIRVALADLVAGTTRRPQLRKATAA